GWSLYKKLVCLPLCSALAANRQIFFIKREENSCIFRKMGFNFQDFLGKSWIHLLALVTLVVMIFGIPIGILKRTVLKDNTSPECNLPTVKFASYFRTPKEQEIMANITKDEYMNGCCQTKAVIITPVTMVDIFNVARDIVQYPDKKQFYVAESC
ncbi:uncharacterized protein LOC115220416, partial [Argonauta hians]